MGSRPVQARSPRTFPACSASFTTGWAQRKNLLCRNGGSRQSGARCAISSARDGRASFLFPDRDRDRVKVSFSCSHQRSSQLMNSEPLSELIPGTHGSSVRLGCSST
jgi:hypothetical protein